MSRSLFRVVFTSRFPRFLAVVSLALIAFVATPSSGDPTASRFDALPRPNEELAQPVWLPHCAMKIVEWRSTPALKAETAPGEQSFALVDDTCREAFKQYPEFLRSKRLARLRSHPRSMPVISLLPANVLLDGKSLRALNDLPSRFEAVAPGCCYWGLYVDSLDHLFLRNDPLIKDAAGNLDQNPRFVRTLIHEISHVLSARLGVWDAVGYDRQHDEDLAEDFFAYMGMHFAAESSAEDLAFHRGTLPYAPHWTNAPGSVTIAAAPQVPTQSGPSANTSQQR